MICLGYLSFSRVAFDDESLANLANIAEKFNSSRSITGILCYSDNKFIQFLEGNEQAVMALLQRVSKDARHGNVTVIYKKTIISRAFPSWGMAIKNVDNISPELRRWFVDFCSLDFVGGYSAPEHQRHIENFIKAFE